MYLDKFAQLVGRSIMEIEELALKFLLEHQHNTIEALVVIS